MSGWPRGAVALGSSPAAYSPVILCLVGQGGGSQELFQGPAPCSHPSQLPPQWGARSGLALDHLAWLAVPSEGLPHPGNIRPVPDKYLLTDTPPPLPWLSVSQHSTRPGSLHFRPPSSSAGAGQRGGHSPPPLTRPILSAKQEAMITGAVLAAVAEGPAGG